MDVTQKDGGAGWAIDDPVDGLRWWGSAKTFELPAEVRELVIGADPECDIVLNDPTKCVSRRHARLEHLDKTWTIHDLDSTNGVRLDGERRLSFQLVPCADVGIGGVTLIAQSPRLRRLHGYLERIIGWSDARRDDVDRALAAIRDASLRGAALVLCGAGDLTGVASRLHALALGGDRPFVVADEAALPQLASLGGGTLCVVAERIPRDVAAVSAVIRAATEPVRVTICAATRDAATDAAVLLGRTVIVELPALTTRHEDHDRLILAYAADAVAELGAPANGFREHELEWLRRAPIESLADLEELGRRIVAVRNWGVSGGAQRLDISHVALSRWLHRRKIPT